MLRLSAHYFINWLESDLITLVNDCKTIEKPLLPYLLKQLFKGLQKCRTPRGSVNFKVVAS